MHTRLSVRSRFGFTPLRVSHSGAGQVTNEVLKTTIKVAKKALSGVPIPGVKGAFGAVLEVLTGLAVGQRAGSVISTIFYLALNLRKSHETQETLKISSFRYRD